MKKDSEVNNLPAKSNDKKSAKADVEILPSLDNDRNKEKLKSKTPEILEDVIDLFDSYKDKDNEDLISDFENLPVQFDKLPDSSNISSNKLKQYIKEISRYELLSREQEMALAKALKETGDIDVAKQLVVANLRLVVKIALEYKYAFNNVMDLIQEGNVGLMKAVSLFDPDKGAKLSYYASWWIKSYILKFILDNFRLVKIGTTNEQKKLFYNLMREKDKLISQGINPDHETLANNLNVSQKAVALMDMRLGENSSEVSLDKPTEDGLGRIGDFLTSGEDFVEDISYQQSLELLEENLSDFVKGLKDRDREIFEKRLLADAPNSLQEIADEYGVSRERVRQIEARLLESLRLYMSNYIR